MSRRTAPSRAATVLSLERRLQSRFKLKETNVRLAQIGMRLRITHPAALDPLLDAAADDPEQQLPYWSAIWPSGIALGDIILTRRASFAGQKVLELGCGLGVTAAAALHAGARLLVTDYDPAALLLSRLNALQNTGLEPATMQINWRRPRPALYHLSGAPLSLVLAADVLYETRDVDPLLELVGCLLAPEGVFWLAEPGRIAAERFLAAAAARGWRDETWQHRGPWAGPEDAKVVVNIHRLTRG